MAGKGTRIDEWQEVTRNEMTESDRRRKVTGTIDGADLQRSKVDRGI